MINTLLGEKLLIATDKRQTTRRHVRCILTGDDYQMVLVDTPGLHKPQNKLGNFMLAESKRAIEDANLVLYIVDSRKPALWEEDFPLHCPVILALNMADLLPRPEIDVLIRQYQEDGRFKAVIPVSALTGVGIPHLLETLIDLLPEGPQLYPEDQLMDADFRFLAAELIREQVLLQLSDEIPHGVAVEITEFNETDQEATISATIIIERESHKAIVIGRGGSRLKEIGIGARLNIQQLLEKKIHLKLWIKVKKNWRKDAQQLKWLGFK